MKINLKVWRQKNAEAKGNLENYTVNEVSPDMSFLEMFDILNEELITKGDEPIAFDHDCREGICGMCSMHINGRRPDRDHTRDDRVPFPAEIPRRRADSRCCERMTNQETSNKGRLPMTRLQILSVAAGLLAGTALSAQAQELQFIMCGGEVRPADQVVIDKFQADNPGVTVKMEAVEWGTCQDKSMQLAAAGDPPDVAYMGSRTLRQLAKNDLIVPVTW